MTRSLSSLFGGADFDLSLELGLVGDDAHVAAALAALWTCSILSGPWADVDSIGVAGRQALVTERLNAKYWRFFGLLQTGVATPSLPFVVHSIREQKASVEQHATTVQFGTRTQEPSDWLTIGIPVRALCSLWSIDNSWIAAPPTSHGFRTSVAFWLGLPITSIDALGLWAES